MSKLLVLDDTAVRRLLHTPSVVEAFPFLRHAAEREAARTVAPKKAGCKPCTRKQRANATEFEGLRTAIGSMPQSEKDKLKKMLGVDTIRVYFINNKRQRIKLTF
jgi:hypothetical protein